MTINGNFTDAEGNPVNIADLLRGVNQGTENQNGMSTISGWVYDGDGNPVNIVDIIRKADSTDVKGARVGDSIVLPDANGYINIPSSGGDISLTTDEKSQLIGLLDQGDN